ncbi:MAG: MBOAT family protein [Cyanobacteriota bacterium]|nr:MBOAT family protein [Cyanobacteriota bacterium]
MTFIDLPYGIFLPFVFGLYWAFRARSRSQTATRSPSDRTEQTELATSSGPLWVLLLTSLFFYALIHIQQLESFTPARLIAYIALLLLISSFNFGLARFIENRIESGAKPQYAQLSNQEWEEVRQIGRQRSTQLLAFGIAIDVLLLVGFKYIPFLLDSLAALWDSPALSQSSTWIGDRLIAPLGISFFTFECIAYLIDVYRGAPATRNWLQFTSYKLFFPKLIAGPITRYRTFVAQLPHQSFPDARRLIEGLWLIACGAFKKAIVADNLGIFVDLCFGNLERAGSGDLWLAIFAYGLQLYFDFSGYVDMARGSALLLGFDLPENFNAPYFASSIADFWRRWHMTLGDWLRNYLYFPLGGSRRGLARTCLNLFLIMLIAGIWHGASWGYVVWGILHGIALVVHRLSEVASKQINAIATFWRSIPGTILAWLLTQAMVFLSWIFFRLPDFNQAMLVVQRFWNHAGDVQFAYKVYEEALNLPRFYLVGIVIAIALCMGVGHLFRSGFKLQLHGNVKLVLVPLFLYAVWLFAPAGGLQYIYFDF